MRYISLIKKKGLGYFVRTLFGKIRVGWFVWVTKSLYRGPDKITFSQFGEDLYIDRILGYRDNGAYLDIGANHPSVLSNTKKFYDRGWRGINVEPTTVNYSLFVAQRPRDININAGVAAENGDLTFYEFDPHTLSTFSEERNQQLQQEGYRLISKREIKVLTMAEIFSQNKLGKIDFVSIDTEGYNLEVLKGNDWVKYRPKLICIEAEDGQNYGKFFSKLGYKHLCSNGLNHFYIEKNLK